MSCYESDEVGAPPSREAARGRVALLTRADDDAERSDEVGAALLTRADDDAERSDEEEWRC